MYHAGSAGLKACSFYNDGVGLSLHPDRLKRYKDVARLLYKYGRTDLVSRAGLDDALAGETLAPADQAVKPDELAADLERLGPAFIKLGQLLSTRADLLDWGVQADAIEGESRSTGRLVHPGQDNRPETGISVCSEGRWRLSIPRDELS